MVRIYKNQKMIELIKIVFKSNKTVLIRFCQSQTLVRRTAQWLPLIIIDSSFFGFPGEKAFFLSLSSATLLSVPPLFGDL